jgi:hypothetical protein
MATGLGRTKLYDLIGEGVPRDDRNRPTPIGARAMRRTPIESLIPAINTQARGRSLLAKGGAGLAVKITPLTFACPARLQLDRRRFSMSSSKTSARLSAMSTLPRAVQSAIQTTVASAQQVRQSTHGA